MMFMHMHIQYCDVYTHLGSICIIGGLLQTYEKKRYILRL